MSYFDDDAGNDFEDLTQPEEKENKVFLFLDTETTGFPNANLDARDPKQGRACQVAFILADENGRNMAEFTSLIAPDGWMVQEGARKIHGLDDALCAKYGIKSKTAFQIFQRLAVKADIVVAHNLDFDWKILSTEAAAHGLEMPKFEAQHCTMKSSTDICRLPKAHGTGWKWPKLEEALPLLCLRELGDGAHDAMVDTRGCRDIYFELKRRGGGYNVGLLEEERRGSPQPRKYQDL